MDEPRTKNDSAARPGMVWLVGAGPGDPDLITPKGRRCIEEADVILHDALIAGSLLDHARPDCEIIHAGKRAGAHAMKQEAINELLAEKAAAGLRVCRLKGGDPFLFGRGGEEAMHLHEAGIPFEIVPGITSAIAVPAYAGIPVTMRHLATSVRIITGHEDPEKAETGLDWAEIAATQGTLVFLMAVRNLSIIAERLTAHGLSPETPAALIANGTLPSQRAVCATLETIASAAEEARIAPPAVLVVGEVVSLRESLAWFEQKPLFGRRILVTRAREQASDLAEALMLRGAEVLEAPAIRIESLAESEAMREAARTASRHDWIVFTSANGVETFLQALMAAGLDIRAMGPARLAAIGLATADRLRAYGLRVEISPDCHIAEALLEAMTAAGPLAGQTILLPRAEQARAVLVEGLRAAGAEVTEVAAYRTVAAGINPEVIEQLADNAVDLVTFTSSSTVRFFLEALPADLRQTLPDRLRAASIGPITSATLREAGLEPVLTAQESTIPGLVAAIESHFAGSAHSRGERSGP